MASMCQLPSVRVFYHQKAGIRIILLSTPPGNIASLFLGFWGFSDCCFPVCLGVFCCWFGFLLLVWFVVLIGINCFFLVLKKTVWLFHSWTVWKCPGKTGILVQYHTSSWVLFKDKGIPILPSPLTSVAAHQTRRLFAQHCLSGARWCSKCLKLCLNTLWSTWTTVGASPGHTNKTTPLLSVPRSSYWDLSDRIWKSIKQTGTCVL